MCQNNVLLYFGSFLSRFPKQLHEMSCEQKVSQVIGSHLHIEAVLGLGQAGVHHDAGVEDENVESAFLLEQLFAAFYDGLYRGKITFIKLQASNV